MPAISEQRCLNHRDREAVARCPSCFNFFCRECVTEHEQRVICARCLAALSRGAEKRGARLRRLAAAFPAAAGLFMLWLMFYGVGRLLLAIPSSFHEGTIWRYP